MIIMKDFLEKKIKKKRIIKNKLLIILYDIISHSSFHITDFECNEI